MAAAVRHWPSFLAAVVSGVLYGISFCGYDQLYFAWLCLTPVLVAIASPRWGWWQRLGLAWLAGLVTHLLVYTWIIGTMRDFGHLPVPLSLLGYVLLCLAQSSLFGAWGLAVHLGHTVGLPLALNAALTMTFVEWLYPALFPSYFANSQYLWPQVFQFLDVTGPLGLTFLLTYSCGVLAEGILAILGRGRFRLWTVASLSISMALVLAYGNFRMQQITERADAAPSLKVGLVQASMGIYEKDANPKEGWLRHLRQSQELEDQGVDLIVWPESGYNYVLSTDHTNVHKPVMGGKLHTPLLFGGLRLDKTTEPRRLHNSAFLADRDGTILGTYDKTFLLAFGEYIPLGDWFEILYRLSPHTGRFTPGSHTKPLLLGDTRIGVLICYEDILPAFTRAVAAHDPHLLVNMTNDAWFGRTHEPKIHLALSAYRAVEHRKYLVRATNTGISAVVDPLGRIVAQTEVFQQTNLTRDVRLLSGKTVYASAGEWVPLACLSFWLAALSAMFLGRARPPDTRIDESPTPPPSSSRPDAGSRSRRGRS